MDYVTIETRRDGYSVDQCGSTLTVAELRDYIDQWDDDATVYFSNDNGYTFGTIRFEDINGCETEE